MIYLSIALGLVGLHLLYELHSARRRNASLHDSIQEERRAHDELFERIWASARQEREILANRIQAPDVAVAQTVDPGDDHLVQFTKYDSDDDFHEALKELER